VEGLRERRDQPLGQRASPMFDVVEERWGDAQVRGERAQRQAELGSGVSDELSNRLHRGSVARF
jgi:hypothetical protein